MSDDLFAPQVPVEVANRRPLADRLRPKTLAQVSGQPHLTGEEGVLRRMIDSGSLGSMIFWGRPALARRRSPACFPARRGWLSNRYQRSFPASPISRRFSKRHVQGA